MRHWTALPKTERARLFKMTKAARTALFAQLTARPEAPKWEYEGDEQSLADEVVRQDNL
jgi:hypothetical protein